MTSLSDQVTDKMRLKHNKSKNETLLIERINQCLKNANEAAMKRVEKLVKSGCIDVESSDIVDSKALAASLLSFEVSQLAPPKWSSYYKQFNSVKKNADCF